jgi:hypothetical protein
MIAILSHKVYVVRLGTQRPEYYRTVSTFYMNVTEIGPQTMPACKIPVQWHGIECVNLQLV